MSLFDKFPGHKKREIPCSVREVLQQRLSVPVDGAAE